MKVSYLLIFFFLLVIAFSSIVFSQVVQTSVIDLSERARDFFVEATKGNIVGQTTDNNFGENLAVGVAEEDIQSQGGILIFLTTAELITLSSTDATDTNGGAGTNSVEVFGLDENFTAISEIVNLSGLTEVNTTKEFIRVNRLILYMIL